MQKRYTITPEFIKFSDINKDDFILSSSLYEKVNFKNTNYDMVLIIRFNYSSLSYEENKNNLEKLLIKAKIK